MSLFLPDIRVKKKETYTSSASYVTNIQRQATVAVQEMATNKGSDEASHDDAVVIENSLNTRPSDVQDTSVVRVLKTSTPPKNASSDAVLIENTHIAATPESLSIDEGSSADIVPVPLPHPYPDGTQEVSSTSDVTMTQFRDEDTRLKRDLTDTTQTAEPAILQIADTSDLTIANESFHENDQNESSSIDRQDGYHTDDLNSNLNNNVVQDSANVAVLIENPFLGTAELLQDAYTIESDGLHLSDINTEISDSPPVASEAETTLENVTEISERKVATGRNSRAAVFV